MEVQNKKGSYKHKVEPRWLSKWDKKLWLLFKEALQNPVPQKNYTSKIARIYENKEAILLPLVADESLIEIINTIKSDYPEFYHKFAARNAICEFQERMAWLNNAPLKSYCKSSREEKSLPAWYELLILAGNDCYPKSLPPRKTLEDWFDEFNLVPAYKAIDLESETFTAEEILAIFRYNCLENPSCYEENSNIPMTLGGMRKYLARTINERQNRQLINKVKSKDTGSEKFRIDIIK